MIVGILVGLIGGAVQIWSWWARHDTKKREDALAAAELALTQARNRREQESHEARMKAGIYDRRLDDAI